MADQMMLKLLYGAEINPVQTAFTCFRVEMCECRKWLRKVSKRYKEKTGIGPEIYVCKIPDGAGELKTIVI